jgi:hypothetical protein
VGINYSDFPTGSLSADGSAVASAVAATLYLMPSTDWSIAGASLYGGTKNLRFRFDTATSLTTALNFNGGEAFTSTTDPLTAEPSRSITIPVAGAGTVTVSGKCVTSTSGSASSFAFICNQDGSICGTATVDTVSGSTFTMTGTTKATDTEAVIGFSRAGATGGGMDVYTVKFTPAK